MAGPKYFAGHGIPKTSSPLLRQLPCLLVFFQVWVRKASWFKISNERQMPFRYLALMSWLYGRKYFERLHQRTTRRLMNWNVWFCFIAQKWVALFGLVSKWFHGLRQPKKKIKKSAYFCPLRQIYRFPPSNLSLAMDLDPVATYSTSAITIPA